LFSVERVLKASHLEEPDIVPFVDVMDATMIKAILGREAKSPYDECKAYKKVGMDAYFIWDPGVAASFADDLKEAALYQGGIKILDDKSWIDGWGRKWIYYKDMGVTWYAEGTIRHPEDLEKLHMPESVSPVRIDFFRRAIKATKKWGLAIVAGLHDAFEIPSEMRGIDQFLLDYYRNPSFAEKLIKISMDYNLELAEALADEGVDLIASGDDYAWRTGPMMPPKLFEKFIAPYLRELVDVSHSRGLPFFKHTDGNVWPIMDYLIESGIDILNPLEPTAGMDLAEAKLKIGDKLCLCGNVDPVRILSEGTIEEVYEAVKDCIQKAAPGGGYMFASGGGGFTGSNPENVLAMAEAKKKYDRYGIVNDYRGLGY